MRLLGDAADWVRVRLAGRVEMVAVARRDRRLQRSGAGPSNADASRLAQLFFEGGAVFRMPTGGLTESGKERGLSLVLMADGDLVLTVPRDFGMLPGDEAAARKLVSDARQGLAAMSRALPASWLGAVYVAAETASVAGPFSWAGFAVAENWSSFAGLSWLGMLQPALSVAGPPLLACSLPFLLGAARPWLGAWVVRRLKAYLLPP